MKKRILGILLCICMVVGLVPAMGMAAALDRTDWNVLTASDTSLSAGKYYLTSDVTITGTIQITGTVTLDLNGCELKMTGSGSVVSVNAGADFTLCDLSADQTGALVGGSNTGHGGVVYNSGVFTMESGIITGGTGSGGGGVFNTNTFNMKGGSIVDCTAISSGGGIYNNYGTVTMEGGTISGCKATYQSGCGGGVFNGVDGTFILKGGIITDCSAYEGGNVRNNGYMHMEGGTVIGSEVHNRGRMLNTSPTGATMCYAPLKNGGRIVDNVVEFWNGESLYAWEVVPSNSKVIKPTDLAAVTGYQFDGWYKEDTFVNEWDFDDAVTSTMKLYAKWTAKAYTVSFDTDGGTKIDDVSIGWDGEVLENVENPEKEGFVFVGWTFNGDSVAEDAVLSDLIDDDTLTGITLTANWDEIITVSVPFTTEVKLGDTGKPGDTEFDLAIVYAGVSEEDYAHVTVSGTLTTNGAGNYDGMLTLTGPSLELQEMLRDGAIVQQVNGGEANWTYDDTVWGLLLYNGAMYAGLNDEQEQTPAMQVDIYHATCEETENCSRYELDWEAVYAYQPVDKMTFTNTYTAHEYALNHDTDGHWDECPCGDVQNQEAHKFGEWTETKAPTHAAKGEKERVCSVCDYTETAEIPMLEKNEPPKTDVPQTGDNSHMALWLALILVSGGALIGITVYGKKRKRSAK